MLCAKWIKMGYRPLNVQNSWPTQRPEMDELYFYGWNLTICSWDGLELINMGCPVGGFQLSTICSHDSSLSFKLVLNMILFTSIYIHIYSPLLTWTDHQSLINHYQAVWSIVNGHCHSERPSTHLAKPKTQPSTNQETPPWTTMKFDQPPERMRSSCVGGATKNDRE